MLSPGQYHLQVPREKRANLAFRLRMLQKCRLEPKYRKAVLHMCSQDILFFINCFVYTIDPRKADAKVEPFICWPIQESILTSQDPSEPGILWCLDHDTSLLLEKSRDMGASWMALLVMAWMFLFVPYFKGLCISRSQEAVDSSDDPDCLFWKLEFCLSHLPKWLLRGFDVNDDKCRKKNRFFHPHTKAVVTGQASTEKSGVGGRATIELIDEFSQIREDRQVYRRSAGISNCRIITGTHKGMGSVFYELSDPSSLMSVGIKKRVMHWTQDPRKNKGLYRWSTVRNHVEILDDSYEFGAYKFVTDGKPAGGPRPGVRSPWYDKKSIEVGDDIGIAEDLDINPAGTVAEVFDAVRINWLIENVCRAPDWYGDVDYSSGKPLLVPKRGGPLKLWSPLLPSNGVLQPGPYVNAWDLSEGVGATPTCCSGMNYITGEKLLEYTNGKIPPEEAGKLAVALMRMLHKDDEEDGAWLIWEMQGPGKKFGMTVIELGWRRMYYRVEEQKLAPISKDDTPGWYPSPDLKDLLLRDYREALYTRRFVNYSEPAMRECLVFEVDRTGHYKHAHVMNPKNNHHAELSHGDHVTADCLACKMAKKLGRLTVLKELLPKEPEVQPGSFAWRRQRRERQAELSRWD